MYNRDEGSKKISGIIDSAITDVEEKIAGRRILRPVASINVS